MIADIDLALLAVIVAACWLGCIGMLRMREPTQQLHFISLAGGIGGAVLPFAFLCAAGWSIATLKAALVALFLIAANSVVAHASARAFRARKLGHWEPREDEGVEFLHGGKS